MTRRAVGTAQRIWAWPFNTIPSDWTNGGGTPTETIVAFDGKHNVYQAAGQAWRIYPLNIKFEPTWLYRIRIRIRRTATSDATKQFVFVGVEGVADDGVTLVNITGQDSFASQHYFGASAQDASTWTLNEWREIVGYFRGWALQGSGQSLDPLNPGFMHANVRYFRPLVIVNYNAGPAGNVMQVGEFVVEALTGTAADQEVPFGPNLLNNPGFESGSTGWIDGGGFFFENDVTNAHSGTWRCRYQGNGVGGPNLIPAVESPCRPGDQFYMAAWAKTAAGTGTQQLAVRWRRSDGTQILREVVAQLGGPNATYTLMSGITNPAPAEATKVAVDWGENTADNSATPWYIDDFELRQVLPIATPQEPEFVHLIEANFSGGSLYLNTGARDLYWNGRNWDAIGGLLTFDSVQESGEDRGRGVAFQLAGVDQTIVATLLNNNYRGRVVRIYRAYLDPASGQVIDPDDRGIQIIGTAARYALRNPVATWPTTNLTLEGWARLDTYGAGTQKTILSYEVAGPVNEVQLDKSAADKLRLTIKGTTVSGAAAFPADGLWHHYAVTWASSGGAWAMYVDGVLTDSGTALQSGASITAAGAVALGQSQGVVGGTFGNSWNGLLDRIRVYNRVLTVSEIAEHALGTILDKTGLLAEWSFDDPGNMGRDGSPNIGTPNDLTPVGISVPSEGSPITKVLLLFEGLQVAPYEIEENRDRSTGTVVIKMQAVGYLGVEKIRGIDANVTSHQHIYAGDTFFQNVASLANLHIYWGTSAPTPIGGGMQGGGAASGGSGGGGPAGKT